MRRATEWGWRLAAAALAACSLGVAAQGSGAAPAACAKPLYLTFDTGHMGVAPLVAEVLKRQQVKVTFFAADEKTQAGGSSLGPEWAGWWKARAAEGHEFASHTLDHVYWRADLPGAEVRFRVSPSQGPHAGQQFTWSTEQYCTQLRQAADRLHSYTGVRPLPLFRAPGGKTSVRLVAAAESCGYRHVGWAPAGFLGDELPSESHPNTALLSKALRDLRAGDILVAHLGIWSRKDPWAPAVLEPLIVGLKEKGFCFRTLREHPAYRDWIVQAK
jgi:peptidoglycan/xylan/chitin deacetylase (PgdA/CDA1 family)